MEYYKITTDGKIKKITCSSIDDMWEQVGGYLKGFTGVGPFKTATVLGNEDAVNMGLPYNPIASSITGQHVSGNILFGGPMDENGNSQKITAELEEAISRYKGVNLADVTS